MGCKARVLTYSIVAALALAACNERAQAPSPAAQPTAAATADADATAPAQAPASTTTTGVPVTVENIVRAESDLAFGNSVKAGGFGKFQHNREMTPIDQQFVVRTNRDTLYSVAVFDLDAGPATITLPDPGDRFMTMQVFDQDQYTHAVVYKPGPYTMTKGDIGTRYGLAALRILANPNDPDDMAKVHALQDQVKVSQPGGPGTFSVPTYDKASLEKLRAAVSVLGESLADKTRMFGSKAEVDPVRRLIGGVTGWGGNPSKDATYIGVAPPRNDGTTVHRMTIGEVPVDGFWSVTVYDAKGYFQSNPQNAYSVNNLTAQRGADGKVTVQFGGCDGKVPNCLPITPGWNYLVRLYRPRAEILDGSWKFPEAVPASG